MTAAGQVQKHTDRCLLPWVQGVFDFLAIGELFLSDTEELSSITTGLWD